MSEAWHGNTKASATEILRSLGSVQPPEGMEARIVQRIRQRQAEMSLPPAINGISCGISWTRWGKAAAMAGVATLMMLLSQRLRHHVTPQEHTVDLAFAGPVAQAPTHSRAKAAPPTATPAHLVHHFAPALRAQKAVSVAAEPSQPPPLPLTRQERLLLALARNPQFASGKQRLPVFTTETIAYHGLGENALFELGHQQLTYLEPLRPDPTLFKPMLHNLTSPGDIE